MSTNTAVAERVAAPKNAGTVGWFQNCIHRSKSGLVTEMKLVTPGLAEVMLSQNHDNRAIRPVKLAQIVSDMRAGRWTLNGEPIIFAKTGELNDGQHRLTGIVESKTPQMMLFVFGVERETRTTVDQGAARSAGDYLHMEGVANSSVVAAVARYLISYERAERKNMGTPNRVTAAEVVERVKRDITLGTSATYGNRHQKAMRRYAAPSVIAFCHNVLLGQNSTEALSFMESLCTGELLERGDPAFRARERLLGMEKKSFASSVEIIFRAYNAYRERRKMASIPVHGRLPELV